MFNLIIYSSITISIFIFLNYVFFEGWRSKRKVCKIEWLLMFLVSVFWLPTLIFIIFNTQWKETHQYLKKDYKRWWPNKKCNTDIKLKERQRILEIYAGETKEAKRQQGILDRIPT